MDSEGYSPGLARASASEYKEKIPCIEIPCSLAAGSLQFLLQNQTVFVVSSVSTAKIEQTFIDCYLILRGGFLCQNAMIYIKC